MKAFWYSKTKKRIRQLYNIENCNDLLPFWLLSFLSIELPIKLAKTTKKLKAEVARAECLLPKKGVQRLRLQSKEKPFERPLAEAKIPLTQNHLVLQNFFYRKPLFTNEEFNWKMSTFSKEILYQKFILKRFVFFKRKLQFYYLFFSSKIFNFVPLNSSYGKVNMKAVQKLWMNPFINSIHDELKDRKLIVSKYLNKWTDSNSNRFLFLLNNYWVNSYLYTSFLFRQSQIEQVQKGYAINQVFIEFRLVRHVIFEMFYFIFNSNFHQNKNSEKYVLFLAFSSSYKSDRAERPSTKQRLLTKAPCSVPIKWVKRQSQVSISFLHWKSVFQHFFFYCFYILNDMEFQSKNLFFNLVDRIEKTRTLRSIFNQKNYWTSTLPNGSLPNDSFFIGFPLFWQLCSSFKKKQKMNHSLIQMHFLNSSFQLETLLSPLARSQSAEYLCFYQIRFDVANQIGKGQYDRLSPLAEGQSAFQLELKAKAECLLAQANKQKAKNQRSNLNSLDAMSESLLLHQLNNQIQTHLVLKKKNFLLFVDLYKNLNPYEILTIENSYWFSVINEIFYFHPVSHVLQKYAKLVKELYKDLGIQDFSNSLIFFPKKWKSNLIYSLSNDCVIWHQIRLSENLSNKETVLPCKENKSRDLLRIQTSTSNHWFSFYFEVEPLSKCFFQIVNVRSLFLKQKKFVDCCWLLRCHFYWLSPMAEAEKAERPLAEGQSAECLLAQANKQPNINWLGRLFYGPSQWSVKTHLKKVKQIFQKLRASPQLELIRVLGPRIRLWSNYYKLTAPKKILKYCDAILFQFLWKWAIRRHSNKSKNWIKNKYFHQIENQNWIFASLLGNSVGRFFEENHLFNFGDLIVNKGSGFLIQIPLHNQKKRILDLHRFKPFVFTFSSSYKANINY
jgi:hypothetical protein